MQRSLQVQILLLLRQSKSRSVLLLVKDFGAASPFGVGFIEAGSKTEIDHESRLEKFSRLFCIYFQNTTCIGFWFGV